MGRQRQALIKKRTKAREASAVGKKHHVRFSRSARIEAAIARLTLCAHDVTGGFLPLADLVTIAISHLKENITPDLEALIKDEPWYGGDGDISLHAMWLTSESFLECKEIIKAVLNRSQRRLYVRQIVVLAICTLTVLDRELLMRLFRSQLLLEE